MCDNLPGLNRAGVCACGAPCVFTVFVEFPGAPSQFFCDGSCEKYHNAKAAAKEAFEAHYKKIESDRQLRVQEIQAQREAKAKLERLDLEAAAAKKVEAAKARAARESKREARRESDAQFRAQAKGQGGGKGNSFGGGNSKKARQKQHKMAFAHA